MRHWQVRRALQPHPDGQRRWDRTYQQLMAWTQTPQSGAVVPAGPVPPPEEDHHEDRDLCTGIHPAPSTGQRPRSATGAPAGPCPPAGVERGGRGHSSDVLVVQIVPSNGSELPKTVPEIDKRLNQITFSNSLQKDLEALSMMTQLSQAEGETSNSRLGRKLQRLQLHRIAAEDHVDGLSGSSFTDTDWALLLQCGLNRG